MTTQNTYSVCEIINTFLSLSFNSFFGDEELDGKTNLCGTILIFKLFSAHYEVHCKILVSPVLPIVLRTDKMEI